MERIAITCTIIGAAVLTWQLTWPDWQSADQRAERIAELERKVGGLAKAESSLVAETTRLASARSRRDRECRVIPTTANVAALMQALSLEVDGHVVRNQTFTVMDRPSKEASRFEVLPVQIEMEADFDNVWSVLERAEELPRLLRVSGLEIAMYDREHPVESGPQPLRATLAIDVVYAPPGDGGVSP
jgi:Tfp pilus assembly protein PilO